MKKIAIYVVFGIFLTLFCCKKSGYQSIGYLNIVADKKGYAIDDKMRSLQIIADDNDGSFSLLRNQSVLFTFKADYSKNNEEFFKSSKSSLDSLRLGAVINDFSIDGLPDELILTNDPKFKGKLKLATYIIDDQGVPSAQVSTKEGRIVLIDIERVSPD